MSLDFTADGAVDATLTGGQERRGLWSVDSSGQLCADVMDGEEVGDAWIVGDTLTLVRDGSALTLHRA